MKITRAVLILVVALALLVFARGWVAKTVLAAGVRGVTGLSLSIRSLDLGLLKNQVRVEGMLLKNPVGFPEPVMAEIPELFVHYDLGGFFQGKIHLEELRLHLKRFVVVKNRQGELNLNAITAVQKAREGKKRPEVPPAAEKPAAEPSGFKVDHLHLTVGKVVYKDYSTGAEPVVHEFNVGIDEHYQDITNPVMLGSLIVSRALVKTTIANLADFDLSVFQGQLSGALQRSGEVATQAVEAVQRKSKEALDSATEKLKTLLR